MSQPCLVYYPSISDHYPIFLILASEGVSSSFFHKTVTKRCYNNFDYDNFIRDILFSDTLLSVLSCNDVFDAWDIFKTEFLKLSEIHAPIHTFRIKNLNNNWISEEITRLIYKSNYLHKLAIRLNNFETWQKYCLVRNQITQVVRQAKAIYYKEQINSTDRNPKQMWKILWKALPSNKYSSQSSNISAQAFNDFFSSVSENLTSSFGDLHLPDIMIDTRTETFSFLTVDINFVLQELLKLPKNSKLDVLNFDSRLLRLASPIMAPILTHIYNLSLCFSSIPADFKKALITPIYKGKGENDNPSNYRPISVVSPIVRLQLLTYFNNHNILSPSQSAYLKYHSTTTALHNLTDYIYSNINKSKVCIGCFLDISKGFDILNTEILLHKLSRHGVRN